MSTGLEPYGGFEPQVGEIRALRTFRVGPGGLLYPLFSDTPWVDGPNAARCLRTPGLVGPPPGTVGLPGVGGLAGPFAAAGNPFGDPQIGHLPPEPECTCGFYAYGSTDSVHEYPHARHVRAVVAVWGRVIAGTRGLRAQYGRVEALWLSDAVPPALAEQVAERYPSVALYRERDAMLVEHPLTELDCYEPPTRRGGALSGWLFGLGAVAAVIIGALPARLLGGTQPAQAIWIATFAVTVLVALTLGRWRPHDVSLTRRRLLVWAIALWVAAPFAGTPGLLLLRLPLLEVVALGIVLRARMMRAANRFPAIIG